MNPLSGLGKRFGSYLYNYHQDQLRPVPTGELMSLLAQMENAKSSASADLSEPIGMAIDAATPIKGVAGILAGPRAKGADMAKLTIAELWDKWGRSAKEIWDETGWFKDAAGNWRWEIPDEGFRMNLPASKADDLQRGEGILGDLAEHPGLFDAYPGIDRTIVSRYPTENLGEYHGLMGGKTPFIGLSSRLGERKAHGVALHELQHAVDDIEGYFPKPSAELADWRLRPHENIAEAVRNRWEYSPVLRERIPVLDMMVPLEKQR